MKNFLLSFLFSLGFMGVFAKIEITDTTNKWTLHVYANASAAPSLHNVYYIGDTILFAPSDSSHLHEFKYKKILESGSLVNKMYLIQEDFAGKVYGWRDSVVLLYDYSLNVGDTLIGEPGVYGQYYKSYVVQADSIKIGSQNYKRQVFKFKENWMSHTVIEGIGSLSGPMYPMDAAYQANIPNVVCFTNHGVSPAIDTAAHFSLNFCTLGIAENLKYNNTTQMVPNPLHGSGELRFSQIIKLGRVDVYNIMGQKILSRQIANSKTVSIEAQQTGQYFYKVTDETQGAVLSGRFIAE